LLLELTDNRWGTMSNNFLIFLIASLFIQGFFYWFIVKKYFSEKKSVNIVLLIAMPFFILFGIAFVEIFVIGGLVALFGG